MKTTVITITIVIVLLIFSLQIHLPIPKTNQAAEADTPAPPTQAQMCGAISHHVDYSDRWRERTIKTCRKGGGENNMAVALECMLNLDQVKNYDQPVITKIKNSKKLLARQQIRKASFSVSIFWIYPSATYQNVMKIVLIRRIRISKKVYLH